MIVKVVIISIVACILLAILNGILNHTIEKGIFFIYLIAIVGLLFVLNYLNTRRNVYYDHLQKMIIIESKKGIVLFEIPIDRIDKILYSAIGFGNGSRSYVIVYYDSENVQRRIRIFPKVFDNSMEQIKFDTKSVNPEVKIRNWTFGVNELFD